MPSSPTRFVISVDSVYPDPVGRLRVRLVFLCFSKPSTFDSRPPLFPKSFSCNTYGSPRKCCKQKTYSMVKLLRCNAYKKQAGRGMLLSFLVAPPYRYVAPTYLLCLPLLRKLPGVYPEFPFWKGVYSQRSNAHFASRMALRDVQPSNLQTILPSHCSARPLVPQLAKVHEILPDPGKQLRSPRCLRMVSGHRGQLDLGSLCKSCLRPAF